MFAHKLRNINVTNDNKLKYAYLVDTSLTFSLRISPSVKTMRPTKTYQLNLTKLTNKTN